MEADLLCACHGPSDQDHDHYSRLTMCLKVYYILNVQNSFLNIADAVKKHCGVYSCRLKASLMLLSALIDQNIASAHNRSSFSFVVFLSLKLSNGLFSYSVHSFRQVEVQLQSSNVKDINHYGPDVWEKYVSPDVCVNGVFIDVL